MGIPLRKDSKLACLYFPSKETAVGIESREFLSESDDFMGFIESKGPVDIELARHHELDGRLKRELICIMFMSNVVDEFEELFGGLKFLVCQ